MQVVLGEIGLVDWVGLAGKTSNALAGAHGERVSGPEGGEAGRAGYDGLLGQEKRGGAMQYRDSQPFQVTAQRALA